MKGQTLLVSSITLVHFEAIINEECFSKMSSYDEITLKRAIIAKSDHILILCDLTLIAGIGKKK